MGNKERRRKEWKDFLVRDERADMKGAEKAGHCLHKPSLSFEATAGTQDNS